MFLPIMVFSFFFFAISYIMSVCTYGKTIVIRLGWIIRVEKFSFKIQLYC